MEVLCFSFTNCVILGKIKQSNDLPKVFTSLSLEPVYVTLHGKRNLADVIVKDLKRERLSWIFQVGAPNPDKSVRAKEGVIIEAEVRVMWPQAKGYRQPVEAVKGKETDSLYSLQMEYSLPTP